MNLVVLVSGRGSNLKAIISACADGRLRSRVVTVISNRPGAPALGHAAKAGIPTSVIPSARRSADEFFGDLGGALDRLAPDLIVLAGFMKILPEDIVRRYAGRIINIHPALLPAFPGLYAQRRALDAGVNTTGCTVHFVDAGCDTGPVILRREVPVLDGDDETSLSARILREEHIAIVEAIRRIETGEAARGR